MSKKCRPITYLTHTKGIMVRVTLLLMVGGGQMEIGQSSSKNGQYRISGIMLYVNQECGMVCVLMLSVQKSKLSLFNNSNIR